MTKKLQGQVFEKSTLKRIYVAINNPKRDYPNRFRKGEGHYSDWIWNNELKENMTREQFVKFLQNFPSDQNSGISAGWKFLTEKRAKIFEKLVKKYASGTSENVATFYEPFIDVYFGKNDFTLDKHSRRKSKY